LGWPEKTKALKTFYPNTIMETGFDIIFFWVARMIMMGIHFMGDVPFGKVYLHAMVRDEKGEKMSKSKGNVIDPLVLIDAHGADPLRFTLAAMAGQGRDIKLSADRVEGYRAFCNKLWNATKFLHLHLDGGPDGVALQARGEKAEKLAPPEGGLEKWLRENHAGLLPHNKWILSRLQRLVPAVETGLEGFNLDESARALYEFSWQELCDWYIELAKLPISEGGEGRRQTLYTLRYVLGELFAVMHPFMPFVTETLWLSLPWRKPSNSPTRERDGKPPVMTLMFHAFPKGEKAFVDAHVEKTISGIRSVVEMIRNFRGENGISPKVELDVGYREAGDTVAAKGTVVAKGFLEGHKKDIMALARMKAFQPWEGKHEDEAVLPIRDAASGLSVDLVIRLGGLVDSGEEQKRLKKEIEKVTADIAFVASKLSKDSFTAKAPPELVAKERRKQQDLTAKLKELEGAMQRMANLK
jgi:valyl-tRNA synthetase